MFLRDEITDRVRFFVPAKRLESNASGTAMDNLLRSVFGLSCSQLRDRDAGIWITCRPDQFCRFMLERGKSNLDNTFVELQMDILPQGEPEERVPPEYNTSNHVRNWS